MRDTIIFAGQSNTFGLGLEWELDPELNSEEYLNKGVNMPLNSKTRPLYEKLYWREYRWTNLVCKELGYIEYNTHDFENKESIGTNGVDSFIFLIKKEDKIKDLLSKTKYVIFETPYIRWFDEVLHGGEDGYKYPNTVLEIIELINNPKSDYLVVSKAIDWVSKVDPKAFTLELYKKINYLKTTYPEITFLVLPWHTGNDGITESSYLGNTLIKIIENGISYHDTNKFITENKIRVCDKAKAFSGKYKFNYYDEHASIEGHRRVAKIVTNYIKKLENDRN